MTGNLDDNISVSLITLKVFERLGYQIDYVASAASSYSHLTYTYGMNTQGHIHNKKCIVDGQPT